jgi:hypothetical protein
MLLIPAELREASCLYREAVGKETTPEIRCRLASYAVALAKLAEKNCRPTGTTIVGQPDSCSMPGGMLEPDPTLALTCSRFVYRVAGLLGLCL